jgi:processing peptidase subunit beta
MLSKVKGIVPSLFRASQMRFFSTSTSAGNRDISAANVDRAIVKGQRLQFSKNKLTDFGDLPLGKIPEALRYDRESNLTKLNNGVRVATETWSSNLATISVHIKAGSRQETVETSGVTHFIEHLNFKGTKSRSRNQLELDIENIGGQLKAFTSRETTQYTITVFKNDVPKAVEILGDIISNSLYNQNQVEAEKEAIYKECLDQQRDQLESTIEAVHYTSFRDHMIGQPSLGIRENIGLVTQDMIKEFHATHYIGPNVVVVGAGDVKHQQLVELSEKIFGALPSQSPTGLEVKNADKPNFTPSILSMRDDEMVNVNVGVFFEAPSWYDEDFYAFQLFRRVLGEYSQDKYTGAYLNSSDRQYNLLHQYLGELPDLTIHKTFYKPYSDTGLFGSYLHGNEVHAPQMLFMSQVILSEYAQFTNEVEVFRARNKYYNELLQEESGEDVAKAIGKQVL